MRRLTASSILAVGLLACAAAGCSVTETTDNRYSPQAVQQAAAPQVRTSCFYSDISGVDRIVGGRVLNWCGPEPKALF